MVFADTNMIAWGVLGGACLMSMLLIIGYFVRRPSAQANSVTAPLPFGKDHSKPLLRVFEEGDHDMNNHANRAGQQQKTQARDLENLHESLQALSTQLQENIETVRALIREAEQMASRLQKATAAAATVAPSPAASILADRPKSKSPAPASAKSRVAHAVADENALGMQLLRERSITNHAAEPSTQAPGVELHLTSQAEALSSASASSARPMSLSEKSSFYPSSLAGHREHRYNRIYALADKGYSQTEIAQQLVIPMGEVELILALRNNRSFNC